MLENRDTNVKQLISMETQRSQIAVLVWQGYLVKKSQTSSCIVIVDLVL